MFICLEGSSETTRSAESMLFELSRSVALVASIRVRLNAATRRPLAMPMSAKTIDDGECALEDLDHTIIKGLTVMSYCGTV